MSSLENCSMSVDKKELGEYGITATITIKRLFRYLRKIKIIINYFVDLI